MKSKQGHGHYLSFSSPINHMTIRLDRDKWCLPLNFHMTSNIMLLTTSFMNRYCTVCKYVHDNGCTGLSMYMIMVVVKGTGP